MPSTRPRSWWTKLIGSEPRPGLAGWPRSRISPASGSCTPARILISVDLPAPFSPKSAVTAPAARSRSTASSASVPPKRFVRPRTSSSGTDVMVVLLLHAPHRQVPFGEAVARDELVLVPALGVHVLRRDQVGCLVPARGRLAVEGAVELVDRLVALLRVRLAHRDRLVLVAGPDALVGGAVAVGGDEDDLFRVDAARPQCWDLEVGRVVGDRGDVERRAVLLHPGGDEVGLALGGLADRRVRELEDLAAFALADSVLGRGRLGAGDLELTVRGDDHPRLAAAVGDDPVGLGAADLLGVLLDVVEDAEVLVRARVGPAVNPHHDDVLPQRLLHRLLQAGDVGRRDDAVGLERDRLVEALDPGLGAAAAVDDRHRPADLLARLLRELAPDARAVVLLVQRHEDDLLAGLRLGRAGRAVPVVLRPGELGHVGLRLRHHRVVLGPRTGARDRQRERQRRNAEQRTTQHGLPPRRLCRLPGGLTGPRCRLAWARMSDRSRPAHDRAAPRAPG